MKKAYKTPDLPITITILQTTIEPGWIYELDSCSDWRGINEAGNRRTRYKRTLVAAKQDVKTNRLQRLISGEWVDKITN